MNRNDREERQSDKQGEAANTNDKKWIGFGLAIGTSFGMLLGLMLHNLAIGMPLGMVLGLIFGTALQKRKDKERANQD